MMQKESFPKNWTRLVKRKTQTMEDPNRTTAPKMLLPNGRLNVVFNQWSVFHYQVDHPGSIRSEPVSNQRCTSSGSNFG
ncbi:hypothetical protein PoB_003366800 [Plakobranchus ocellatus]|uniref:Uncharacterized protein n=1 Tax=Plakobranchus ocellatus TaxID=259542 RepID=A0AAV4AIU4_9GAST|nr:hypothetical protein PoB_003366800 [Plakobranchus ocellatus]